MGKHFFFVITELITKVKNIFSLFFRLTKNCTLSALIRPIRELVEFWPVWYSWKIYKDGPRINFRADTLRIYHRLGLCIWIRFYWCWTSRWIVWIRTPSIRRMSKFLFLFVYLHKKKHKRKFLFFLIYFSYIQSWKKTFSIVSRDQNCLNNIFVEKEQEKLKEIKKSGNVGEQAVSVKQFWKC